jgi:hypothetical protein
MPFVKQKIKKILAFIGFINPTLGVKINGEAKATIILEQKKPGYSIFIETGTNRGDMIERMSGHFKKIYSIELDPELHKKAREKFANRNDITLIQGDSGTKIKEILANLQEPALFWLDAHEDSVPVSGPDAAPIEKELEAIFNHSVKGHEILIDDGRHFDLEGVSLIKKIARKNDYTFKVKEGLFILSKK